MHALRGPCHHLLSRFCPINGRAHNHFYFPPNSFYSNRITSLMVVSGLHFMGTSRRQRCKHVDKTYGNDPRWDATLYTFSLGISQSHTTGRPLLFGLIRPQTNACFLSILASAHTVLYTCCRSIKKLYIYAKVDTRGRCVVMLVSLLLRGDYGHSVVLEYKNLFVVRLCYQHLALDLTNHFTIVNHRRITEETLERTHAHRSRHFASCRSSRRECVVVHIGFGVSSFCS